MSLSRRAAEEAVEQVGARAGLDRVAAAWGIHQIVSENMAAAARVYMIERGQDPRRYAMLAFGGAGPAHASRVARILRLREFIVPPASGAASALGFLVTPISFDFVHSLPGPLESLDWEAVDALVRTMEGRGRAMLRDAGGDPAQITSVRRAGMRLARQFHDIAGPGPGGRLGGPAAPGLRERVQSGDPRPLRDLFPRRAV